MPKTETMQAEAGVAARHKLSETAVKEEFDGDLNDIKLPFIIEDVTLMSPGTWNNKEYRREEIQNAYNKTDWEDSEVKALFYEHDDEDSRSWVGQVVNARQEGTKTIGDLEIVDMDLARKLAYGAKFGISPKVTGFDRMGALVNYEYDNFSVVIDPAVKTTYMNSEDGDQDDNDILVNTKMSQDKEVEELSEETQHKLAKVVSKVEDADVQELSEILAPFLGMEVSEIQPHLEDAVESYENEDDDDDEEEMDMEKVAKKAARSVMEEMQEDNEETEDDEEEVENSEDEDETKTDNEDDEEDEDTNSEDLNSEEDDQTMDKEDLKELKSEIVDDLKEELSEDEEEAEDDEVQEEEESLSKEEIVDEVKEEMAEEFDALKDKLDEVTKENSEDDSEDEDDDEDQETIENKTPKQASQTTGEDKSPVKKVEEMSAEELDVGAAKFLLSSHTKGF